MKRLTNCMTTAAAVLMIGAGVASAQNAMKAEVPFAFSVGGKVAEPGTYRMRVVSGHNNVLSIQNAANGHGYLLLTKGNTDAPKKWIAGGVPRAAFDCTSGACILSKVWFGEGSAYAFHGPKTKGGEMMLTEIIMKPDKGD